jgi:hypothetical protein
MAPAAREGVAQLLGNYSSISNKIGVGPKKKAI